MRTVEIKAQKNGAHKHTYNAPNLPAGHAVIPDGMVLENFPFGDLTAEEIDGVMTVTSWTPGEIPEPEPMPEAEPSTSEILDTLLGVSE